MRTGEVHMPLPEEKRADTIDPTLLRVSLQRATALPLALRAIRACPAESVLPVRSALPIRTGALQAPLAALYRANQILGRIGPPLGRLALKRLVCCWKRTRMLPPPSCAMTGSATPRVPSLIAAGADHNVPSKRLHTMVGKPVAGLCTQTAVARPVESMTTEGESTLMLEVAGASMLMRTGNVHVFDAALWRLRT